MTAGKTARRCRKMSKTENAWDSVVDALTHLTQVGVLRWEGSAPNAKTNLILLMTEVIKPTEPGSPYGFVPCLKVLSSAPLTERIGEKVEKLCKTIQKAQEKQNLLSEEERKLLGLE